MGKYAIWKQAHTAWNNMSDEQRDNYRKLAHEIDTKANKLWSIEDTSRSDAYDWGLVDKLYATKEEYQAALDDLSSEVSKLMSEARSYGLDYWDYTNRILPYEQKKNKLKK